MKNKAFQTLLKVWITVASVAAFLFGWIVLGHSGKPVSASTSTTPLDTSSSQLAPLPTLPPLPILSSSGSNTLQALPQIQSQVQQPSSSFFPSFRTRGS